jgi:parallel beta-helix repeat protein
MERTGVAKVRTAFYLMLGAACALSLFDASDAHAFPGYVGEWEGFYGPVPVSPEDEACLLCHGPDRRSQWNGYGFAILQAFSSLDPPPVGCNENGDGQVQPVEAFVCVEPLNSDGDPTNSDNLTEITANTQPGWTEGANNTLYDRTGIEAENQPPATLPDPPYDPAGAGGTGGSGGMGGMGGMGGGGTGGTGGDDCEPSHDPIPPGQFKRGTIVVKPGQSIQEAIDRAQEGTRIYVHAGVYEEPCNPEDYGLRITKSGIHLVGQSNPQKRVIFRATNGQRNGIVVVPPEVPEAAQPLRPGSEPLERTDCLGCHAEMGPPFTVHPDVPKITPMDEDPWLYDIVIEGITIQGFQNNGLFTEHVDHFVVNEVSSLDNRNYGIFPVLSKNGIISNSYASGSDRDSGIWVETSERVLVAGNVVEYNVNGIEVSNSDDILVINNEMRNNTVGANILLLPDIFDDRAGAKRIDVRNNWIHDNNEPNNARPGSILSFIPPGIGVLYLGVDDSVISNNVIERNNYVGVAIADYCVVVQPTPFGCGIDPDTLTPGFLEDQTAKNNRVENNVLIGNAGGPFPPPPFGLFAADLSLITLPAPAVLPSPPFPPFDFPPEDIDPVHNNCYAGNGPGDPSFFSFVTPTPPPCL